MHIYYSGLPKFYMHREKYSCVTANQHPTKLEIGDFVYCIQNGLLISRFTVGQILRTNNLESGDFTLILLLNSSKRNLLPARRISISRQWRYKR